MVVALVDDNKDEQSHTLQMFIDAFKTMRIPIKRIDRFSSGEAFLENWEMGRYDLIILDILMDQISGIGVAKEIRRYNQDVRIVFCSSSNEYAYESYMLNASYYIQKPITFHEINQMVSRLHIEEFESRRFIILPNDAHLVLRDMIYAESSNHVLSIHLKSEKETSLRLSLTAFMKLLEPYDFFLQCNKGSVVNMYEVDSLEKDLFTMSNGELVSISRRKRKDVEEQYLHFLFETVRSDFA